MGRGGRWADPRRERHFREPVGQRRVPRVNVAFRSVEPASPAADSCVCPRHAAVDRAVVPHPAPVGDLAAFVPVERVVQNQPFAERLRQRPVEQHEAHLFHLFHADRHFPEERLQLEALQIDHALELVAVAQFQRCRLMIGRYPDHKNVLQRHVHLGIRRLHGYRLHARGPDDARAVDQVHLQPQNRQGHVLFGPDGAVQRHGGENHDAKQTRLHVIPS